MEFILIIFLVTAPIFWLYGIVVFLRNFTGKKHLAEKVENETSTPLLVEIVSDLEEIRKKNITIAQTLAKYKARLSLRQSQEAQLNTTDLPKSIAEFNSGLESEFAQAPVALQTTPTQPPEQKETMGDSLEKWWERWYLENNINLLLYIGTFLIISSAAIFVGFNWATFSGPFKSSVLSLITLAFFAAGFFFYFQTPKLKNAGATFLAIGALLIPFNGLAWYNFALRDSVSFATVWLTTSIISVTVYLALAYFIRNRFYTYIAGLGGLSLIEAMVSISGLNTKFYILGGIFSSFVLLAGSKILATTKQEDFDRIYSQPLSISSNIFMPVFLTWGLSVAFSTQQLFTSEVVISTFLASAYYFLSYLVSKNISLFTLGELLLTLALVLLTLTAGNSGAIVFVVIFINALVFQIIAYPLKASGRKEEAYYSVFVATFIALLGLSISFVDPLISAEQRFYFTLIVATLSLLSALLERIPTYLYITFGAINISAYLLVTTVWNRTDLFAQLGLFYLAFGSCLYLASKYLEAKKTSWAAVFLYTCAINLVIGVVFCTTNSDYLVFASLLIAFVATLSHYFFNSKESLYSFLSACVVSLIAVGSAFMLPDGSKEQRLYYTLTLSALASIGSYIERNPKYIYLTVFGFDVISFTYLKEFLNAADFFKYLSLIYLFEGVVIYSAGLYFFKKYRTLAEVLLFSCVVNFGFGLLFSIAYPGYALTVSVALTAVTTIATYYFDKREFLFAAVGFAALSTLSILRVLNIDFDYYPIAFGVLGYLIYFIQFSLSKDSYKEVLKTGALAVSIVTPIIFGFYSFGSSGYNSYQYLELSALLSAYAATGLLTLEALNSKKGSLGYTASAVGLLTILWQYNYLGITIFQVYAVTVGVYFMILSYINRSGGKKENQQIFDILGLGILLVPLTYQAFPDSGFLYALQLGIEGLILVGYGFSTNYKTYTYVGSAAIAIATISRVYSFVASLGSWAIIGTGGLIFLGFAIYLLNARKQE